MTIAFQDALQGNHCFGCGPDNAGGLQIKSHWRENKVAVCHFSAQPHHCSGPENYLNGGILATVIDCHCVCTAIARGFEVDGREVGEGEPVWYVTGNLEIAYLKPVPIDKPLECIATIIEEKEKKSTLLCEVFSNEQLCAKSTVIAVKVSSGW